MRSLQRVITFIAQNEVMRRLLKVGVQSLAVKVKAKEIHSDTTQSQENAKSCWLTFY